MVHGLVSISPPSLKNSKIYETSLPIISFITSETMLLYSVKELSNYYYDQTETNIHLALIDINFAKSSRKSRLAAAGEVVDAVDAGGIVLAGVALAFVDVHLAVHA